MTIDAGNIGLNLKVIENDWNQLRSSLIRFTTRHHQALRRPTLLQCYTSTTTTTATALSRPSAEIVARRDFRRQHLPAATHASTPFQLGDLGRTEHRSGCLLLRLRGRRTREGQRPSLTASVCRLLTSPFWPAATLQCAGCTAACRLLSSGGSSWTCGRLGLVPVARSGSGNVVRRSAVASRVAKARRERMRIAPQEADPNRRQRPGDREALPRVTDAGEPVAQRAVCGRRREGGAGLQGRRRGPLQADLGPAGQAGGGAGCRPGRLGLAGSVLDAGRDRELVRERFRVGLPWPARYVAGTASLERPGPGPPSGTRRRSPPGGEETSPVIKRVRRTLGLALLRGGVRPGPEGAKGCTWAHHGLTPDP